MLNASGYVRVCVLTAQCSQNAYVCRQIYAELWIQWLIFTHTRWKMLAIKVITFNLANRRRKYEHLWHLSAGLCFFRYIFTIHWMGQINYFIRTFFLFAAHVLFVSRRTQSDFIMHLILWAVFVWKRTALFSRTIHNRSDIWIKIGFRSSFIWNFNSMTRWKLNTERALSWSLNVQAI